MEIKINYTIREISGKFRGNQWNSVGFCMALNMNSVGIPGGFRATPGFQENLGFGVVSGDLGPQKALAQMASQRAPSLRARPHRRVTMIMVGFFTTEATIKIKHARRGAHFLPALLQKWETDFYTPPVLGGAALSPFSAPAVYKNQGP